VKRYDRFRARLPWGNVNKVIEDLDLFMSAGRSLWRDPIDDSLKCANEIFLDKAVLPGSGRSFPTMLLYSGTGSGFCQSG